jgi:hypothetical protein
MVNFISPIIATTLVRKREKGPHKYDTTYLFLSSKSMLLGLKIPLLE